MKSTNLFAIFGGSKKKEEKVIIQSPAMIRNIRISFTSPSTFADLINQIEHPAEALAKGDYLTP